MILTDAKGRPIEPPAPPSLDASIDDRIAYLRAHASYNDHVAALAHKSFAVAFQKSLKRK